MTSYVHFNANILLLLVLFSAEAYFKATYKEDFRVIISDNGRIRWRFGGHIRTVCPLDITYYPFDEQVCDVNAGTNSSESGRIAIHFPTISNGKTMPGISRHVIGMCPRLNWRSYLRTRRLPEGSFASAVHSW